jgi:glutamate 5-kinase
MVSRLIAAARKIVVKIGSSTLTDSAGRINKNFMREFAGDAAALTAAGKQFVLVSSGAQIAGISAMDKWSRKQDIHYKQALCAVGQVKLMEAWDLAFQEFGLTTAQILLTGEDFGDDLRTLHMRNTLFTLVDEGIIPVINENDTVCVDEIKIGDNDTIAAQSAVLWSADLLILFSDIDGLYDKNPREFPDAAIVKEVPDIDALAGSISLGKSGAFGSGGISTKVEAARRAVSYGIPMILAHGGRRNALAGLAAGTQDGTAFLPR